MAEQSEVLRAEGIVVGTVELSDAYVHLYAAGKRRVALAAYRKVQQACGEEVKEQHQDEVNVGTVDTTHYNSPCVISLEDDVCAVHKDERQWLSVRVQDVSVASTMPLDPCRLLLVVVAAPLQQQPQDAAAALPRPSSQHIRAAPMAVIMTAFSLPSLTEILNKMTTINPTIEMTTLSRPDGPPPKPPRASQRKLSQKEESTRDQTHPGGDLPPKLSRKGSKNALSLPPGESHAARGAEGKEQSDAVEGLSSECGHYPLRGQLSGKLRAQDCNSGIYDTLPPGPPKKVAEENTREEGSKQSPGC